MKKEIVQDEIVECDCCGWADEAYGETNTIETIMIELKQRRDWNNPQEVEIWFERKLRDVKAEAVAEDRARVRGNLPEIRVSALSLLLNDCANCGQVINRSFVDDLTCRIQDEYKQKILSSLDELVGEKD